MDQLQKRGLAKMDKADFLDKLRSLRKSLPKEQRKAFNAIVGGAIAAFRLSKDTTRKNKEGDALGQKLAAFRDELPPPQRAAFTSMVTTGIFAWAVAADRAPKDDVRTIAMWHALLPALAIITVGTVLIIDELTEDEEEPLIPDIQLPPLPE